MWTVLFHDEFHAEFKTMPRKVRVKLVAVSDLLEQEGPQLPRPRADTLSGSEYSNMKELRFSADGGVWRAAFAFDPERRAIILVAGDKTGENESRFYKWLIATADERYKGHLEGLKKGE